MAEFLQLLSPAFNLYGYELPCTNNHCTSGFLWHWPDHNSQKGWDWSFSPKQRDYWKRDLLCLMNALQNLAVGSSWKISLSHVIFFYCKLFAVRFSSFGPEQHTHKPCQHSLMWSALLISVGQLLMLEDEASFVESKQEWGERWHTCVCVWRLCLSSSYGNLGSGSTY